MSWILMLLNLVVPIVSYFLERGVAQGKIDEALLKSWYSFLDEFDKESDRASEERKLASEARKELMRERQRRLAENAKKK